MPLFIRLLCLLVPAVSLLAQDAQYWNSHYGEKGVLLGGAVIGSVDDLSAIYYNPGFLGIEAKPGLSIGTGVFDVSTINISNLAYVKGDAKRTSAEQAPGLVAGQIQFDSTKKNHFTYGILGRQSFDVSLMQRSEGPIANSNGTLSSAVIFEQRLDEVWAGISWARAYNKHIGYGVTLFGAHRTQFRLTEVRADADSGNGVISGVQTLSSIRYWSTRILAKAGIFIEYPIWSAGLTITTPSVAIMGSGQAYSTSRSSGMLDSTGARYDVLRTADDANANARYLSSIAIGIGGGYRIGNTRFHASVEWHDAVGSFTVIDTHADVDPNNPRIGRNTVVEQLRAVTNVGVGVEVEVDKSFSYYASAVTDFSAVDLNAPSVLALSTWDIYHVTAGTVFTFKQFRITTGLGLAYGSSNEFPRTPDQLAESLLLAGTGDTRVIWWRARVLLGLTYRV